MKALNQMILQNAAKVCDKKNASVYDKVFIKDSITYATDKYIAYKAKRGLIGHNENCVVEKDNAKKGYLSPTNDKNGIEICSLIEKCFPKKDTIKFNFEILQFKALAIAAALKDFSKNQKIDHIQIILDGKNDSVTFKAGSGDLKLNLALLPNTDDFLLHGPDEELSLYLNPKYLYTAVKGFNKLDSLQFNFQSEFKPLSIEGKEQAYLITPIRVF